MTTQEATLIAAVIAAFASVAKLFFDRFAEGRLSIRTLLLPLIAKMGEAVYGIVATSSVMLEAETDAKFRSWHSKACHEREKLRLLRPKLRHPLWGLDEGLRVLERLPDWCSHARSDKVRASQMLRHATSLRQMIDVTALRCYSGGRRPNIIEVLKIRLHSWQCRRIFEAGRPSESQ
jgi:hypothetical protein